MPVYYRVCLYLVAGTDELALYFTVYSGFVDDKNKIQGSDKVCKGDKLALGIDG